MMIPGSWKLNHSVPPLPSISIIVPTLWACSGFPDSILEAAELDMVKEIIIIDNNHANSKPLDHKKVTILVQPENIYVNPAWNLGARMATGDILCFLNDDLWPRLEVYSYVIRLFHQDSSCRIGLIGMNWNQSCGSLGHEVVSRRTNPHFGAMIFTRRSDYTCIPNSIKVWWGDEFLVFRSFLRRKQIIEIHGYSDGKDQIESASLNTNREAFNRIIERDTFLWLNIYRRLLLLRHKPIHALAHSVRKRFLPSQADPQPSK